MRLKTIKKVNQNRYSIKEPLYISKKTRRGLVLFFIIGVGIVFIPRLLSYYSNPKIILTIEDVERINAEEIRKTSLNSTLTDKKDVQKTTKKVYSAPPHRFDPNRYSTSQWMELGLSKKQVDVILKFTKNGIASNTALKKIYVLPNRLYELIKDSTVYPEAKKRFESQNKGISNIDVQRILELNACDSLELISLKGIGPFYASQILRYRKKLGGFYAKEQLKEVWKMKTETYEYLLSQTIIDSARVVKIKLNMVGIDALKRHPYLNYPQANSIVKMRSQKGRFTSIDDIKRSKLIDPLTYQKLRPYLTLD